MSKDFYITNIFPYRGIIIKICRAYSNSQEDYEDYYQEVCLQIWKSRENFKNKSEWSTWVYRIALNVCLSLLRKQKKHNMRDIYNMMAKYDFKLICGMSNQIWETLKSLIQNPEFNLELI